MSGGNRVLREAFILHHAEKEHFPIVDQAGPRPIYYSSLENQSVIRAITDLQGDISKVTGQTPDLNTTTANPNRQAIVVATLGTDRWTDSLIPEESRQALENKWESFVIETIPATSNNEAMLLIIGSDHRGTIYGIYELTEQMGISPWYWWMDVPISFHPHVFIKKGRYLQGEPSVKYRGFFLNDEGPSLMTWTRKQFPDFTHEFYEKIFELTLRLKANYHWPAMWDSTFYEDDDQNIVTAKRYGVVIGTSHHEPMNRPHGDWKTHKKGPWDYHTNNDYLYDFWKEGIERTQDYETIVTLGMRGDGDEAMGGALTFEEKSTLLETIVADQRDIIQTVHADKKVEDVPQLWALYKEVKDYYDAGMTVPEDVTLLWGDDNFGNIRRLPTEEEANRSGGAGIYYHLDYVGGPRNYKWVNTVPIEKIWEQMNQAYLHQARKIWILNVGDLKPMEFQMEFFLRMAWDVTAFNQDNLWDYSVKWAAYHFGEAYAVDVARIIHSYSKQNGRLKPEMFNNVFLYSQTNYQEAERILAEFEEIVQLAEQVLIRLPEDKKDAFFQVAYYPAKASYTVLKMHILIERSRQLSQLGVTAANTAASEAEILYLEDELLAFDYNRRTALGKWQHMMDQIHFGYTYWQQPEEKKMPDVYRVTPQVAAEMVIRKQDVLQTDFISRKELAVDIFNKGEAAFEVTVDNPHDWLKLSFEKATVFHQKRLIISVDWAALSQQTSIEGELTLRQIGTDKEEAIKVSVANIIEEEREALSGFVPLNGVIAIEAEHFSRKVDSSRLSWQVIPHYGRTLSSLAILNETNENATANNPSVEYDIVIPQAGTYSVMIIVAPSLDFTPGKGLRLAIGLNDDEKEIIDGINYLADGEFDEADWEDSVTVNCRKLQTELTFKEKGQHRLVLEMIDSQVVIQKIIIDLGGLKPSYLGPVETPKLNESYQAASYQRLEDYQSLPEKISLSDKGKLIFIPNSGLYTSSQAINKLVIDDRPVDMMPFHLTAGYHYFRYTDGPDTAIELELLEADNLHIKPTIRQVDGTVIQLGFINQDKRSHPYMIHYRLFNHDQQVISENSFVGILEKEGQEMINSYLPQKVKGSLRLDIEWHQGGRMRRQVFEF